jgi:hypothetical protein
MLKRSKKKNNREEGRKILKKKTNLNLQSIKKNKPFWLIDNLWLNKKNNRESRKNNKFNRKNSDFKKLRRNQCFNIKKRKTKS